jgi:hypothetical protein
MSTTYNGDPTAITNSTSKTITNATNATPIVITTSVAHTFHDGDTVVVSGVGGNTAANGTWAITYLTTTTFSLDTSVGSGAYTSGGTAVDVSMLPAATLPSDGDNLTGASVNPAFQNILDKLAFLGAVALRGTVITSTGTANYTCAVSGRYIAVGFGAGAGGGGGVNGGAVAATMYCGGGGGGAAIESLRDLGDLTAGTQLDVTIGAGGGGGAVNAAGSDGGDSIVAVNGGAELARWKGAAKGYPGGGVSNGATSFVQAYGGGPVAAWPVLPAAGAFGSTSGDLPYPVAHGECWGGIAAVGQNVSYSLAGSPNSRGFSGGTAGTKGTSTGTRQGGGGGGGGAAGPRGAGGNGGNGGNANDAGVGTAAGASTAAAANTGAGGGGGGTGGVGSSGDAAGSAGSAGGSGRVVIFRVAKT